MKTPAFIITLLIICGSFGQMEAATGKYRLSYNNDPSTSIVIGWDQLSGDYPVVWYDEVDHGRQVNEYRFSAKPSEFNQEKQMKNFFAFISGLKPGTTYYFVIKDNEGVSDRYYFQTIPNDSNTRLSIIAGGDSRNNREARRSANLMVSKLRPHFVMFGGDMTELSTAPQWQSWFDDWQLTISPDGRITPIVVTRGNHEASNQELVDLFQIPSNQAYYALNFGGNLLRLYTLNSLMPSGGVQRDWLERDLRNNAGVIWKFAQYHHTIRPHTTKKQNQNDQYEHWAKLFYQYGLDLVVESDAHVVKTTWPISPSTDSDSYEGFIRDEDRGTVYLGEGCWGAPIRSNNDDKPWTRNSGSFNQFKWIFVDHEGVEIRTIMTDNSEDIASVDPNDIFTPPFGLPIWNPSNGPMVKIDRYRDIIQDTEEVFVARDMPESMKVDQEPGSVSTGFELRDFSASRFGQNIAIQWTVINEPNNADYEVQRSVDGGISFETIHKLKAAGRDRCTYEKYDDGLALSPGQSLQYRLVKINARGEKEIYNPSSTGKDDPSNWEAFPKLVPDQASKGVQVAYQLDEPGTVSFKLMNPRMRETSRLEFTNQAPGRYMKTMDLSMVPAGRYLLVIRTEDVILRRYRVNLR
ncbi:MAG: metallophosphoesterase family protein [Bacteroidetes bacterium]|nr:metallophosphoesterase family protein [Bacteroidota bacterium]